MKRIFFVLLVSSLLAPGQNNPDAKRDYVWVFGSNYDAPANVDYTIDFNSGFFETHPFQHNIRLWQNNASIADSIGNLLFFTNGRQIVNKLGNIMENGDSINNSSYYDYYNQFNIEGALPQTYPSLPCP
ncbi:MAG: hypothetical protein NTU44_04245 [Bacteroidetes bacterium]|nr:hypothetical protein [Bacteroidota bacterium]